MRQISPIAALAFIFLLGDPVAAQVFEDTPPASTPIAITVQNGMFYVDDQPLTELRGVTYGYFPWRTFLDPYSATPRMCYFTNINQCPTPNPTYTCTNYRPFEFLENFNTGAYQRDFPLIKLMGANALRVYDRPTPAFLQAAKTHGFMVFDSSFLLGDQDFTFAGAPQQRQQIINDFVNHVTILRNTGLFNYILAISFGAENDLQFCSHTSGNCNPQVQAQGFFQLANDAIAAAKAMLTDAEHRPFTVVTGNFNFGIPTYIGQPGIADDTIMSDLDFWSATVFWGTDFGGTPPYNNLFTGYAQTPTNKPFFVSGFGLDGFHVNDHLNPQNGGYSDPVTQGKVICNLWEEIRQQMNSPQRFVLGGVLETWTDAWGKPGYVQADFCSALTKDPDAGWVNFGMPDNFYNEEDTGINDLIPDLNMTFQDGVQIQWSTVLMYQKWNFNIQCPAYP